jgi:hypothetical protein
VTFLPFLCYMNIWNVHNLKKCLNWRNFMKKLIYCILIVILFSMATTAFSQNNKSAEKRKNELLKNQMFANSSQGREFWIAIPMNDPQNTEPHALEIYVTSTKNATVTMESQAMGVELSKSVTAMKITTFSSIAGECSFQWECSNSEVADSKAIRLFASQPISVYVLNAKLTTSDGFMAIPLNSLGTEYIHCSYYDHNEVYPWAGGFICIGTENQTKIRIELKGKGYAHTKGGRKIGDIINASIDAGQVYMVKGDATTRMEFDMTGSSISSDKPIGLISFHERTHIPSYDIWNGRDCLNEMIPPVKAWGKKFATIEFFREMNKGDYFRVVASQPDTYVNCTYFDMITKKQIGTWNFRLEKAGDWNEYLQVNITDTGSKESIRGVSIFEANKPVLVMQYSYSMDWDGAPMFDPDMVLVSPQEQYVNEAVFQTPSNAALVNNYFNIIAIHDPNDTEKNDLKSITLDGLPIYNTEQGFLNNRISQTDLYWARLSIKPAAHIVRGDSKFGGMVYGMNYADSYAWPIAMGFNKIDELDTLPPVITISKTLCGFCILATELRNGSQDDSLRQIDQGINTVVLLDSSVNVDLIDTTKYAPPNYEYSFFIQPIDRNKDAIAYFAVEDNAGNIAIDSIKYPGGYLKMEPVEISFQTVYLGASRDTIIQITNALKDTIKIKRINFKNGYYFKIFNGAAPPDIILKPDSTHKILIGYSPLVEHTEPDLDTIEIHTECGILEIPVSGKGKELGYSYILVSDVDFRQIEIGKIGTMNATIQNSGNDDLKITGFSKPKKPFIATGLNSIDTTNPLVINPKNTYNFNIIFNPTEEKVYQDSIVFFSNATKLDSICRIKGEGRIVQSIGDYDKYAESSIKIIPNPNDGNFDIYYNIIHSGNVRIYLMNCLGEKLKIIQDGVMSQGVQNINCDINEIPSGLYHIVIETPSEKLAAKIAIIK